MSKTDELDSFKMVKHKIVWEGFDYCFRYYSSFREVKDEEFHELIESYLIGKTSRKKLEGYVNEKIKELSK